MSTIHIRNGSLIRVDEVGSGITVCTNGQVGHSSFDHLIEEGIRSGCGKPQITDLLSMKMALSHVEGKIRIVRIEPQQERKLIVHRTTRSGRRTASVFTVMTNPIMWLWHCHPETMESEKEVLCVLDSEPRKLNDQFTRWPFPYGNVYEEGRICWGDVPIPTRLDPIRLSMLFWASGFNLDLRRRVESRHGIVRPDEFRSLFKQKPVANSVVLLPLPAKSSGIVTSLEKILTELQEV